MADERVDVAALGLEAAAAVVERMLELGRSAAGGIQLPFPANGEAPVALDAAARAQQARRFRADGERLLELYADWTRLLVDGVATLAEQALGEDGGRTDGAGVLVLGPAVGGASTGSSAWLHVLDGPVTRPAVLHATALVAHDGTSVPGAAVRFEPAVLDTAVPRSTSEVRIVVDVPAGTPPGRYHGHVLAAGLEEVALPVRLEVVV